MRRPCCCVLPYPVEWSADCSMMKLFHRVTGRFTWGASPTPLVPSAMQAILRFPHTFAP